MVSILQIPINAQPAKATPKTDQRDVTSLPPIDWAHYHNYSEMVSILFALNETYPDIIDVFSIGRSWQNRDIYCVRLTNESSLAPKKPQVFFGSYLHAREPITAELALYFLVQVATNYATNATIKEIINKCEIYVVVALNVDGLDLFKANDWQRKNARPIDEDSDGRVDEDPPEDEDGDGLIEQLWTLGTEKFIKWEGFDNDGDGVNGEDWVGGVDLNRNYGYGWQDGTSDPLSEIYKGPAPFSEPETMAIRNLVQNHNFTFATTYHSGAELILYPWGCTYDPPPDKAKFLEIAQDLSALTGGTLYEQAVSLYPSYGTIDDWIYFARGTFILTCEIFENTTYYVTQPGPYPSTEWRGYLRYSFNPFPQRIEPTLLRWLPTFYYVVNRAVDETSEHDIAVTSIQTSKTIVGEGYSLRMNITIRNKSTLPETTNVTVYANSAPIALVENLILSSLVSKRISVYWDTKGRPTGQYTIAAIAATVAGEKYVADNTLTDGTIRITIAGDVNGDFYVNMLDATQIGLNWMKTLPTAPPNADIIDDGIINIKDATVIGTNWQRSPVTLI